jgi:hypothetical protein
VFNFIKKILTNFLAQARPDFRPLTTNDPVRLKKSMRSGDVLLVEGETRFGTAIKYLSQSTWSHAALYVGEEALAHIPQNRDDPLCMIEADIELGVIAIPLSKYTFHHTRICRPMGLDEGHKNQIIDYLKGELGKTYDLENIIKLGQFLFPITPIPTRWRRKWLTLGSDDPTQVICSSMIAQAFQLVNYPILPVLRDEKERLYQHRHHTFLTPSDFDQSPYFQIIKPTLEVGFEFQDFKLIPPDKIPDDH